MKYFFILGRNPELSVEEIRSYFGNLAKEIIVYKNVLVASFDKHLPEGIIKRFGGIIALGNVLVEENISEVLKKLDSMEIYFGNKNNFSYAVWNFSDEESSGAVLDYLKSRFKGEKFKASLKPLSGTLDLQSGDKIRIPNSSTEEEYVIFSEGEKVSFGRIIEKSDYKEVGERDIKKPVRRESLAISPRLAKIMINLSGVKENEILVDPFCGIGSVLQEALIKGIRVIGIDRDAEAIDGAKKNLEWGKFNRKNYSLLNSNSLKVRIPNANVVVTEPDLGETLRKIPNEEKAKETLSNYENLMISVLNNLKPKISGKFVFTAPYISLSKNKRAGCDINRILSKTSLKLRENFPISEVREGQIVGRQIFVLER